MLKKPCLWFPKSATQIFGLKEMTPPPPLMHFSDSSSPPPLYGQFFMKFVLVCPKKIGFKNCALIMHNWSHWVGTQISQ